MNHQHNQNQPKPNRRYSRTIILGILITISILTVAMISLSTDANNNTVATIIITCLGIIAVVAQIHCLRQTRKEEVLSAHYRAQIIARLHHDTDTQ